MPGYAFLPSPISANNQSFNPVGDIASTTVQTAIAELDTEKAPKASPVFTGTGYLPTTKADQIYDYTSTSGWKYNSTSGRWNLYYSGWEFEHEGGILTPVGKTKVTFAGTGGDQTFTVPAGITTIYCKIWGAGGGNGRAGGWSYGSDGGGGGHTRAMLTVTPAENLTIKVGSGGKTAVNASSYGGGGGAVNASDTVYCGQGGGGSYIFRSTTPLLIAGGGGGGGSSRIWTGNIGGAGGGTTGQNGESPYDGKTGYAGTGGTQSAGGSATGGNSGSLYQGGASGTNSYGGGGGGGYYGGGGGGYSESNTMAGGGGGSGYVVSTAKLGGTFSGAYRVPAFFWDNDLVKTVSGYTTCAYGAQNLQNNIGAGVQTGGNGFVVIYY